MNDDDKLITVTPEAMAHAFASLSREARHVVAQLAREGYDEAGQPYGPPCDSLDCISLATKRIVSWPCTTGKLPPIYCDAHALWSRQVMETGLGIAYRDEPLPDLRPKPFKPTRKIAVTGSVTPTGENK
jgi:hypothetical protein